MLGIDASDTAIQDARTRLSEHGNVRLERVAIPREWPDVRAVDLVVVSEIGYFLTHEELEETLAKIETAASPAADVLLCHWLHPIDGWSLMGEDVHAAAHERGWKAKVTHRETDFLLEVFALPVTRELP